MKNDDIPDWANNAYMCLAHDEDTGQVIGIEATFLILTEGIPALPAEMRRAAVELMQNSSEAPTKKDVIH